MSDQKPRGCLDFARLSRRDLLQAGTLGVGGLSLASLLAGKARAEATPGTGKHPPGFGRAKRCILLFMWGGPSHLETWDLKPAAPAEVRGEFKPISTNVAGIQISEHFPLLARQADKYAIIRSMTHDDPAHLSSVHALMTGRLAPRPKSDADPPSRRDWPQIGTFLSKMRPSSSALPPSVTIPWIVSHPAAPGGIAPGQHGGMLGPAHDPFVIEGDPSAAGFQVGGLSLPGELSRERLESRRGLLRLVDGQRAKLEAGSEAEALSKHQTRAIDLLTAGDTRSAFDLSRESPQTRERYGQNIHGQCVLMARRLVEAGVQLVCVNWHNDGQNFWDTHGNNFVRHKNDLMPPADRAFAELLEDLSQRGLLDETLVVWVGEFGRNPRISNGSGREHWPWCYSAVVAGGGVRGGQVYGKSDPHGAHPAGDPVSPGDLCATMYHALGIPHDLHVSDREGRPVRLTEGQALAKLFG